MCLTVIRKYSHLTKKKRGKQKKKKSNISGMGVKKKNPPKNILEHITGIRNTRNCSWSLNLFAIIEQLIEKNHLPSVCNPLKNHKEDAKVIA